MPLDPFFAERLVVHRRYLIGRALARVRARIPSWIPMLGGTRGATAAGVSAAKPARTNRSATTQSDAERASSRAAARTKHRRAAVNWDRKELETVGTPGPDIPTQVETVPVDGYPSVRVRLFRPRAQGADLSPAVLAFFGGGFRVGGIDYPTTDASYRRRAADADIVVVAVDYALAPEHKYPTQVEQGYAALVWLFAHAKDLGIDPDRIGIAGTSAGGAIAAAVTLMNRDRAKLPLRLQLLEVPVVDLTGRHIDLRATRALGIPTFIARRELLSVARTYLPSLSDAREPYASPMRAASHQDLPPAVILTAEYDPLRGDGTAYGAALRQAGVDAAVVQYLGVTHDVPIYTGKLPASQLWHEQVIAVLRRLHVPPAPVA